MRVYERIRRPNDKLIHVGPKRKTLSRIIIKSFELTPDRGSADTNYPDANCYFVGQTQTYIVIVTSQSHAMPYRPIIQCLIDTFI